MTMTRSIAGLVLAGGQSQRMGQDKAQLRYHGRTWLDIASDLLVETGCNQILLNTHGHHQYPTVAEPYPNQGPLSGIYAGLVATQLDLLIVPVDMPTLSLANLSVLIDRMNTQNHQPECVYFNDSPLPCLIKNSAHTRQYLKTILSDPMAKNSVFAAWRGLKAVVVEPVDRLENFNTPGDIKHLPS